MQKLKFLVVVCFIGFLGFIGWQVGACVIANMQLRDDMQDIAAQVGGRIGLNQPGSDDDFRKDILRHAQQHGIDITPDQVIVQRTGTHPKEEIYLAVDYPREVHILGIVYVLHFTPEIRRQFNAGDWRI